MKEKIIKKLKSFIQLVVSDTFFTNIVTLGKEGYGNSYSWKDRHLFFERNK
jgi:hypothetical protein